MITEKVETKRGVGALIVSPKGTFATIQELTSSEKTNKIAGMRSLPMETVEAGEDLDGAWVRMFKEELQEQTLSNVPFTSLSKLCRVQLTPGVWLHAYLIRVGNEFPLKIGTASQEVANPQWMSLDEVRRDPLGSLRFRPGVREVVTSFDTLALNSFGFTPAVFDLVTPVPSSYQKTNGFQPVYL